MAIIGRQILNGVEILEVDANPITAGLAAPISSIAFLNDGSGTASGMWQKSGSANNAWTDIANPTSAAPIFGSQYQKGESLTTSTTTNLAFQQKLLITTPTVPAGEYRIGWVYGWSLSSVNTGRSFRGQVTVDGTPYTSHFQAVYSATTQVLYASGFFNVDLTNTTHTVAINYCTNNAAATASIRDARLEIWRVS